MMIEAVERRLVAAGNVAQKLARRPDVVRQLAIHDASIQAIPSMGIEIVGVTEATMRLGLRHQSRYGLLTNDSLVVASMQQRGVRLLPRRPTVVSRPWTKWRSGFRRIWAPGS